MDTASEITMETTAESWRDNQGQYSDDVYCAVVTFNCGRTLQDSTVIASALDVPLLSLRNPEFIVVCLQEIAPVITASLHRTGKWIEPFIEAAPSKYRFLGESTSGSCAVLVFLRSYSNFNSWFSDVSAFGALWSSLKGAALFSIKLPNNRGELSFVSAHLSAHEGRKEQRNRDYNYMIEDLGIKGLTGQVIIAGDLNYRTTDGKLSTDELTEEMAKGKIGHGYTEAPVLFEPSFKFQNRTNDYDTSKKNPSYCDRILFRDMAGVEVVKYDSIMAEELDSDHKPVYLVIKTPANSNKTGRSYSNSHAERHDHDNEQTSGSATERLLAEEHNDDEGQESRNTPSKYIPRHLRTRNWRLSRLLTYSADLLIATAAQLFTTKLGMVNIVLLIGNCVLIGSQKKPKQLIFAIPCFFVILLVGLAQNAC